MIIKIVGSLFVILGCGGCGFIIAGNAHREMLTMRQLISGLEFMECELNYRLTPLPHLFRLTSSVTTGCIHKLFLMLADELERQSAPSVDECISLVLSRCPDLPALTAQRVIELGRSLGSFDLTGQIKCIKAVNDENMRLLNNLRADHKVRIRSYKTLGLCAGAALIILFI